MDDVVIVAHLTSDDYSLYAERYKSLAKQYRDRFTFGILSPAKETSLKCRNNIDDDEHVLTELWRVEAFENFVRMCSRPLVALITKRNEAEYMQVSSTCTPNDGDLAN